MKIEFKLESVFIGISQNSAEAGEKVRVLCRDLLGPTDFWLSGMLQQFDEGIFGKIPGMPPPHSINHLVVVIRRDLSGIAYINELNFTERIRYNESVREGDPIFLHQIKDIASVDLGIEVPRDSAVIVIRSFRWKRSLFFDLGPLSEHGPQRDYDLKAALANQSLLLLGISDPRSQESLSNRAENMLHGISELESLLEFGCESESRYQQVLSTNPWMLSGFYRKLERHEKMDDGNIPDFTGIRAYDGCHDIIELKHPFLKLFKASGDFAADFNDSWNQAERYISFSLKHWAYLQRSKNLRFENPKCILVLGYNLNELELRAIREKEESSRAIHVLTYDQLLICARHIYDLMRNSEPMVYRNTN